ncbi:MAG: hypothetical protein ACO3PV_06270, partial [Pseudohongiellaceae bacterium]
GGVARVDLDERKIELQLKSGGTAGSGPGRALPQRERGKARGNGKPGAEGGRNPKAGKSDKRDSRAGAGRRGGPRKRRS